MIVFVQQVQQTHLRKSRKYPYMTRCTLNSNLLMQCSNPLALKAIALSVRFSFNFEFWKLPRIFSDFYYKLNGCNLFAVSLQRVIGVSTCLPSLIALEVKIGVLGVFLVVLGVFLFVQFTSVYFHLTPYNGTMGVISGHHVAWLSIHVHVFW